MSMIGHTSLFSPHYKEQQTLGSCISCSLVTAYEMIHGNAFEGSALFVHYHAGLMRNGNMPLTIREALLAVSCHGICSEASWPYKPENASVKPPQGCYKEARKHKLKLCLPADTVSDQRTYLTRGYPLIFSYDTRLFAELGLAVSTSSPFHSSVGFRADAKGIVVRNSWGREWNGDGNFLVPWHLCERSYLMHGCVAIVRPA